MGIFDPRPMYRVATRGENLAMALDLPLSPWKNFTENVQQGALDSFGAGSVLKDLATPRGIPGAVISPLELGLEANPLTSGLTRGYEALRGIVGAQDTLQPLSEDAYKASEYYRKDIPWDAAMTVDRAAALATQYDVRQARTYFGQKDMLTTLAGGFVGGLIDPINYVPIFGPGARAAAAARFGYIAGHAMIGASEAAINTAVFGMLTAPDRARYGEDTSFEASINNIAFSAIAGGIFGALGGAVGRATSLRALRADQQARFAAETIDNLKAARSALNDGVASLVNDGEVKASPSTGTMIERLAGEVNDKRLAARSLDVETRDVTGTKAGEVVISPSGNRVAVRPEVVELSSLKPATGDLQVRDRSGNNAVSAAQIEDIALNLDPARLMPNVDASQGAPLVGPDSIVDSGNGRVGALARVYENYPDQAAAYRAALEANGYSTEGLQQPVLIQRRVTDLSPAARVQFNADVNNPTTARMSAVELAQLDRALLDDQTLGILADAPVTAAENRPFVARFLANMPQNDRGALLTPDGQLNADGVRRIENALVAAAYGDVDAAALRKFAEATDDNTRAVVGALADVAGNWLRMRRAIKLGDIGPEFDTTAELTEALRLLSRWRDQAAREKRPVGTVIKEGMAQGDMLSGSIPAPTRLFIRSFYADDAFSKAAGREKIAGRLNDLVNAAMDLGQPDMLGDAYAATKLGVLQRVYNDLTVDGGEVADIPTVPDDFRPAGGGFATGADQPGNRQAAGGDGNSTGSAADVAQARPGLAEGVPDPAESLARIMRGADVSTPKFADLSSTEAGRDLFVALRAAKTLDDAHLAADQWVNKQGLESGVEHLAAFDADGNLLVMGRGANNFVAFPDYFDKMVNEGKVRYATHNHPRNSGLSSNDLIAMMVGSRPEGAHMTITAMGAKGAVISAEPGPNARALLERDPQLIGSTMADADWFIRKNLQTLVNVGAIDPGKAQTAHAYLSNLILHQLGIIDLRGDGAQILDDLGLSLDHIFGDGVDAYGRPVNETLAVLARRAGFEFSGVRDFDRTRRPGGLAQQGAAPDGANQLSQAGARAEAGGGARFRGGRRERPNPDQLKLLEGRRREYEDDGTPTEVRVDRVVSAITEFADKNGVDIVIRQVPGGAPGDLEMTDLNAREPGKGSGTKVMTELGRLADENGLNVYTSPATPRNSEFYQRFDFERGSPRYGNALVRYAYFDIAAHLAESSNDYRDQPELFGDQRFGTRPLIDMQEPRPEPVPDGLEAASVRVGKGEDLKALAEQHGVNPDGTFLEQADIEQMRSTGRLTVDDQAELDAAQRTVDDAEAYAEALRAAAACVMG